MTGHSYCLNLLADGYGCSSTSLSKFSTSTPSTWTTLQQQKIKNTPLVILMTGALRWMHVSVFVQCKRFVFVQLFTTKLRVKKKVEKVVVKSCKKF